MISKKLVFLSGDLTVGLMLLKSIIITAVVSSGIP